MSKIANIVLNAIESRARIVDKNGKKLYTIKSYSEFHVYTIIRLCERIRVYQ